MRTLGIISLAIAAFLIGAVSWTYLEESQVVSPCLFAFGVKTTEQCKDDPLGCALAVRVIDGDTIECHGHVLRLAGYNAPELSRSICVNPANQQKEYEQGRNAKKILKMLIAKERWPHRPRVGSQDCGFGRWCFNLQLSGGKNSKSYPIGEVMTMCGQASPGTGHTGWCRKKTAFNWEGCEAYMRDRFPKQRAIWQEIISRKSTDPATNDAG
jgi:hypothetical protein